MERAPRPLNKDQRYVEGLESFLESSGEDRVDIDGILEQLPKYAAETDKALKQQGSGLILDVGSGNGAKAIYLAQQFEQVGIGIKVDSIEPKAEQRNSLAQRYSGKNNRYQGTVTEKSLEELAATGTYDIVLVVHSLYEFPRNDDGMIRSLDKLPQLLKDKGAAVLVHEAPQGDLQRMKRELYPEFGKREPVSQELIVRTLEKNGIEHQIGNVIEFQFELDQVINKEPAEVGKALEFLFSDSLEEEPLSDKQRARVGEWVKQNVRREDGHSYLWTPDIAIWVKK